MLYKKSRKLYKRYDEENEELINRVESINGYAMIINSINLVLTFFFFGTGVVLDDYVFDLDQHFYYFIIFLFSYIINIIIIIKMQQKQVDFEKEINPEKSGSIYDIKFAKKWEESCDGRERLMIYKSSYKAYKTTSTTCIVIWMLLVFINFIWDTGIMPIVVVTVIWGVLICSYSIEAIKLQKFSGK